MVKKRSPSPAAARQSTPRKKKSGKKTGPALPGNGFIDQATDVATALFLDRGFDNTPMSLVARRLGLTKAGVYHHFETKEHLLYVVHQRMIERMLLPIICQAEAIAEPMARLRSFIFEYARLLTRDPAARVLITESRRLSSSHFNEIRTAWRRGFRLVRDAVVALQASGHCRRDIDPTYTAFAGIGMCSWILFWFDNTRPENGDIVAATMCEVFLSGILTPKAG